MRLRVHFPNAEGVDYLAMAGDALISKRPRAEVSESLKRIEQTRERKSLFGALRRAFRKVWLLRDRTSVQPRIENSGSLESSRCAPPGSDPSPVA
jgi:hypothetical protein